MGTVQEASLSLERDGEGVPKHDGEAVLWWRVRSST